MEAQIALEIQKMNIGKMSEEERRKMDKENEKFTQDLTEKTLEFFKTLGYKQ
jgi:hypothetical protein